MRPMSPQPVNLSLRSPIGCSRAETWMLSSGIYSDPVHRPCVGFRSVRTVVPTMFELFLETSRCPRVEAQATLPQSASPQGAMAIIALPIGFFHWPSIGVAAGGCAAAAAAMSRVVAAVFIVPPRRLLRNTGYEQV